VVEVVVRGPSHQPEGLAHALVGHDVEERRLAELRGQALPEREIEDGLARPVVEAGQHDGVAVPRSLGPGMDEDTQHEHAHDGGQSRHDGGRSPRRVRATREPG
jgi:hypothetical protein